MSYTDSSGGTLTLPSPNTAHHVDMTAAVRSLRRSFSRSPSKLNLTRSCCQYPNSILSTPSSPSPCRIIQRPMPPTSAPQLSHRYSPTSFSTPLRPVKLSLRSGKPKATSAKVLSRTTRISPNSPPKRALKTATDSGNLITSFSPPSPDALLGQENNNILADTLLAASPTSRKSSVKNQSRHSLRSDVAGASRNILSRPVDLKLDSLPTASVSPLKRSDAFMSPIEAKVGNPVAKRRSLHGIASTSVKAPSIFDQHASKSARTFDILEDKTQEIEHDTENSFLDDEVPASPTPMAMPRRSDSLRRSTLQQRQVDKPSWGRRQGEKHLAQMGAEAATPVPRNRPRISLDQFVQPVLPRESPFSNQAPLPNPSLHMLDRSNAQIQRHPLSRSLTTSSSNSSLPDDSPTHIPVQLDRPRAPHPFAKSMPLGARPLLDNANKNIATPAYKNARPFQDAFKSTGLISKVNRNPELGQSVFGGSKAVMPDTPCKKPIYPLNTFPPSSGSGKGRHRHSFGSPSSPFSPARKSSFVVLGDQEKVSSLFKPIQPVHARKGSSFSPEADFKSHTPVDVEEFPPTPTKSVFFKSISNSKSVPDSPFVKTGSSVPALASALSFRDAQHAIDQSSSPFRPAPMFATTNSPKTPRDTGTLVPPDLNCLSIPNSDQASSTKFGSFPPVTPTAREDDHFGGIADRRISITPVNGQSLGDIDLDLKSRFDQVEIVGKGEFSQVYRVTRISTSATTILNSSPGTPPTPSHAQVYAVKKTRLPFFGARDREAKLREVNILQALRGRPHVLQFIDSWEKQYHLYIQTEYCEEGSLSEFLGSVGAAGRLDDFRIWKILVEASMGLQSIHEAGFIHLDFKPANVLIDYEGQLKIGDFGLATQWPAARGIECEGDRRYIAPEILEAKYDKPADVFSLGLVMFEIASNVWLPDNGPVWHALRAGNFAAVPTGPLTGSESDALNRDATGMPIAGDVDAVSDSLSFEDEDFGPSHIGPSFPSKFVHSPTYDPSNLFGTPKRTRCRQPPAFMVQNEHQGSLDKVVTRMLAPSPADRPTVQQLLEHDSIRWVIAKRRAGATVYEGNWGPQSFGGVDADMLDV